MSDKQENGVIDHTEIGWGRCGPQLLIYLKLGSGHQGFVVMAGPQGVNLGSVLFQLLKVFAVDSWEKLCGVPVRIQRETGDSITAIGHFYENRWFNHKEWWDNLQVDAKVRIAELEARIQELEALGTDDDEEDVG